MVRVDDFKPLLALFRFIAAWCYFVDTVLSPFSGFSIPGLMEVILMGIAFINSLTVGILDHKEKKRVRMLGIAPKRPSMIVICLDFFLATGFLATFILIHFVYGYYSTYDLLYRRLTFIGGYTMVGALVGIHFELFFAAIGLHMWRQHRNGRAAATSFEQRERRKDDTMVTELSSPVSGREGVAQLPA